MRQLVQLQERAAEFQKAKTKLVFVFREEEDGVDGLKKIKSRVATDYTLALDLDKQSSKPYSEKKMTFDNYVIRKDGTVKAIIDGSLRTRATADDLLKAIREFDSKEE